MKTVLYLALALCGAGSLLSSPALADPVDSEAQRARAESALLELEARVATEPPVGLVQRWAVSAARMDPRRTAQLLLDGQRAGGLPYVRMRGRFQDEDKKEFDEVALLSERNREATWTVELWLEWDLADAVAGPARFRAAKEARSQVELRQAIAHGANVAYFDRRRLLSEAALDLAVDPTLQALARAEERRLRIAELDGLLDALTGGRWSRALHDLVEPELPPAGPVLPSAAPEEEVAGW